MKDREREGEGERERERKRERAGVREINTQIDGHPGTTRSTGTRTHGHPGTTPIHGHTGKGHQSTALIASLQLSTAIWMCLIDYLWSAVPQQYLSRSLASLGEAPIRM